MSTMGERAKVHGHEFLKRAEECFRQIDRTVNPRTKTVWLRSMRQGTRSILALMLLPSLVLATTPACAAGVIGIWLGHDRDGYVEISPCGKFMCGYIISILDPTVPPNPRDIHNENPVQRSRPICGLQVLGELKHADDSWGDGWVYDPRRGKRYTADIWLNDPNTLSVRGYVGIKIMSETKIWTRAGKNVARCIPPRP